MLERRIVKAILNLFGVQNPDAMTLELVNQKFRIHNISLSRKMALAVLVPALCNWLDMKLTGEIKEDG